MWYNSTSFYSAVFKGTYYNMLHQFCQVCSKEILRAKEQLHKKLSRLSLSMLMHVRGTIISYFSGLSSVSGEIVT